MNTPTDYECLTSLALVDFSARTRLAVTGADRAKFLHNLTTNNILALQPGQGCEAFVLNVQGKILGHVLIFCEPDALFLDTVPGQAEALLKHFNRYLIREDVQLADRSSDWSGLLVTGKKSWAPLFDMTDCVDMDDLASYLNHATRTLAGRPAHFRHVSITSPREFLIHARGEDMSPIRDALSHFGFPDEAAFESARIERGTPLFGRDITEANLPQEVARDALAISLTKGCYLGQETVARIDALGHVNRLLCGVRLPEIAEPGTVLEFTADGKPVGKATSVAYSPKLKAPLALAYIRRGHHEPGTKLDSSIGPCEVVGLPVS